MTTKESKKLYAAADKAFEAAKEQDRQELITEIIARLDAIRSAVKGMDMDAVCSMSAGPAHSLVDLENWMRKYGGLL